MLESCSDTASTAPQGSESDEKYAGDESEEHSSTGSPYPVRRKRSTTGDDGRAKASTKRRRLRKDGYALLLDQTLRELLEGPTPTDAADFEDSQIGITTWTAHEKSVLFTALDRRGRHDVPALAAAAGTKSIPEVQDYLNLLQKVCVEESLSSRPRLLRWDEFPAAVEIGEELEQALDKEAEQLRSMDEQRAVRQERAVYGSSVELSEDLVSALELKTEEQDQEGISGRGVLKAALATLNVTKMLELSSTVFMNTLDAPRNWHLTPLSRDTGQRFPSMFCGAAVDLHKLVFTLTQKVTVCAHFFALSRLRAVEKAGQGFATAKQVKRSDVEAALETLGLKRHKHEYWVGVPRRNKLKVYSKRKDRLARVGHDQELSYDEVEQRLQASDSRKSSDNLREGLVPLDCIAPSEEQISSEVEDPQENDQDTMNAYAEFVDRQASLIEEGRLWHILGKQPTAKPYDEQVRPPKLPGLERKAPTDLIDWTTFCQYVPPWECFEAPVPDSAFAANRKPRPNEERDAARDASGENSPELEGVEDDTDASSEGLLVDEHSDHDPKEGFKHEDETDK